jgi:hypothetical protein
MSTFRKLPTIAPKAPAMNDSRRRNRDMDNLANSGIRAKRESVWQSDLRHSSCYSDLHAIEIKSNCFASIGFPPKSVNAR